MTATMMSMNLVHADVLVPDQLMEGDIIRIEDENGEQLVEVKSIHAIEEGWVVEVVNDFGEVVDVVFDDEATIDLYVYID
jgi:hypothetical protein